MLRKNRAYFDWGMATVLGSLSILQHQLPMLVPEADSLIFKQVKLAATELVREYGIDAAYPMLRDRYGKWVYFPAVWANIRSLYLRFALGYVSDQAHGLVRLAVTAKQMQSVTPEEIKNAGEALPADVKREYLIQGDISAAEAPPKGHKLSPKEIQAIRRHYYSLKDDDPVLNDFEDLK